MSETMTPPGNPETQTPPLVGVEDIARIIDDMTPYEQGAIPLRGVYDAAESAVKFGSFWEDPDTGEVKVSVKKYDAQGNPIWVKTPDGGVVPATEALTYAQLKNQLETGREQAQANREAPHFLPVRDALGNRALGPQVTLGNPGPESNPITGLQPGSKEWVIAQRFALQPPASVTDPVAQEAIPADRDIPQDVTPEQAPQTPEKDNNAFFDSVVEAATGQMVVSGNFKSGFDAKMHNQIKTKSAGNQVFGDSLNVYYPDKLNQILPPYSWALEERSRASDIQFVTPEGNPSTPPTEVIGFEDGHLYYRHQYKDPHGRENAKVEMLLPLPEEILRELETTLTSADANPAEVRQLLEKVLRANSDTGGDERYSPLAAWHKPKYEDDPQGNNIQVVTRSSDPNKWVVRPARQSR